ncbi:hypothetical protein [Bacillus sp. D386]|uniref:hypothetical protein n=1 Tax=Bacillus sp. D386 TaxID=2587155 RepID=UPI0015D60275|nr:hypothetical protein [Bacillus sp. D386]
MDRQPLQVTGFSKELNLMLALIKNNRDSVKILLNSFWDSGNSFSAFFNECGQR